MRRFGLVWRVGLIVAAALMAVQFIAIAANYIQRDRDTEAGFRLPLPDQVAAMVHLLEEPDPGQHALVLRAINGAGLRASIVDAAPPLPSNATRLGIVEQAVASYLADEKPRDITVYALTSDERMILPGEMIRRFGRVSARFVVGLTGGQWLVVESTDELTARVFGLPPGLWSGLLGFLIAAAALVAVVRETRPLARLGAAVERFGEEAQPVSLPETGASEVRALTRAFNRMQGRIATLVRARTFILGAISHDLRTYLTRLRLRIEMLPEGDIRDRSQRDVEDMNDLLEDALLFAKAGFGISENQTVDLGRVVERECEARIAAGAPVRLAALPAAARVSAGAAGVARIAANLIDNAVAYGGCADVSVVAQGDRLELRVEDRGPGVPPGEREHIFEPFRRLEASRNRRHGGAGLGLAIARQLAQSYGGELTVGEREGGGARFVLALPRLP
ncbi:ATP-binding protein [Bosea sp. 117]|uniref:ATP-binding protein n=1 Tax=Bosea sp. 117 TaxID=1125973 RepID=UPI000494CE61|nr:ATP-binding protein [Bosea sp. 117]